MWVADVCVSQRLVGRPRGVPRRESVFLYERVPSGFKGALEQRGLSAGCTFLHPQHSLLQVREDFLFSVIRGSLFIVELRTEGKKTPRNAKRFDC